MTAPAKKHRWWPMVMVVVVLLATTGTAGERSQVLVLGEVADNPNKRSSVLQSMVDYAAAKLADTGIIRGEVFIAKNLPELIGALREGRVDWVADSPFPALLMVEQAKAEIIARRWKKGSGEYAAILFVHQQSAIQDVKGLIGTRVAFGDRDSTTSHFVPLAVLRTHGLAVKELASPRELPPTDRVAYLFAQNQVNIFNWVQRQLVEAGTASTSDWEEIGAMQEQFRIVHQSRPFPRGVVLVRKDLEARVKTRLREVLLNADRDPDAQETLATYDRTTRFDPLDDAAMEPVRDILDQVRDVLP